MAKSKSGKNASGSQRANVKNPNNRSHKAALDNRSNQLNPNNGSFNSSRQGNRSAQKRG